jgi:hypothetical protein
MGDRHPAVAVVKKRLGVWPIDDTFTPELAARVRGVQRMWKVEVTGLIEDDFLKRI